jgi:hypothetical protein
MCGYCGPVHPHHHGHPGCCCAPGYGWRRFRTKEEEVEELERYKEQLERELEGISKRLEELGK